MVNRVTTRAGLHAASGLSKGLTRQRPRTDSDAQHIPFIFYISMVYMVQGASISKNVGWSDVGFKVNLVGDAKKLLDVGVIADLLEEALQYGEQMAHSTVPYDTGNLDRSIGHFTQGMRGSLFANADYASYVEYGHRTRSGSFVPAQPYLRPAADDAMDRFDWLVKRHASSVKL